MDLAEVIKQYYFDNQNRLSNDKQFHFASRIAAWQGDERAYEILEQLKTYIVPNPSPDGITGTLKAILEKRQTGRRNAHELRQTYFQKYPSLWGTHLALFRVRHLEYIYGTDAKVQLFELVSRNELDQFADKLIGDDEAVRVLSTFAINFIYLYTQILLGDREYINPQHFIDISDGYDLSQKEHLQLLIYLFTHCVIGETNFYIRPIDRDRMPTYHKMLEILDKIIKENYELINLDNKLEFLVCCRICSYKTGISKKIYAECHRSISSEGHFLVDSDNQFGQESRKSFEKSEHRNVLFIMSVSPYSPHSTLL